MPNNCATQAPHVCLVLIGPVLTWPAFSLVSFGGIRFILSSWPVCPPVPTLGGGHGSETYPGEMMGFSRSGDLDSYPFPQGHHKASPCPPVSGNGMRTQVPYNPGHHFSLFLIPPIRPPPHCQPLPGRQPIGGWSLRILQVPPSLPGSFQPRSQQVWGCAPPLPKMAG